MHTTIRKLLFPVHTYSQIVRFFLRPKCTYAIPHAASQWVPEYKSDHRPLVRSECHPITSTKTYNPCRTVKCAFRRWLYQLLRHHHRRMFHHPSCHYTRPHLGHYQTSILANRSIRRPSWWCGPSIPACGNGSDKELCHRNVRIVKVWSTGHC
jgi:hypothetical protein